jgi:hypothetical protein
MLFMIIICPSLIFPCVVDYVFLYDLMRDLSTHHDNLNIYKLNERILIAKEMSTCHWSIQF